MTRCEPPTRLSVCVDGSKGSSRRGEYLFDYELAPSGAGTEVTLRGEVRGLSGFANLVGKLFVGSYKKACAHDLRALAEYLAKGGGSGPAVTA